jgi:hypothetical protein
MKKQAVIEASEISKSKAETHKTMGGKVNIYRRGKCNNWHCSTFLNGRNWRVSTCEKSLGCAKDFAEDWYLGLRGLVHAGLLPKETRRQAKRFKEAAAKFLEEAPLLTHGQRGPTWLKQYELKRRGIILPFLGEKSLAEITPGLIQEYRIWRAQNCKTGRTAARSTLHKEIVCIRLVLKTASRHGWMEHLPDMSAPYKTSGKITHRAWFSPEEYTKLYEATRRRARQPRQIRFQWECEQLHDYVEFAVNTGLRPDEALRLQFGDVKVVEEEATDQTILEIEVRGKRGVGYCKSTEGAVPFFGRLKGRVRPDGGPGRSGSRNESVVNDPDAVAEAADWPVNEADQHARHLWLASQEEFRENMKTDPEFYDAKIAGWWVWGQCIWIGSGWCSVQLPHLGSAGAGVHRKLPHLGDAGRGVNRQLPHLGDAGTGGGPLLRRRQRPHLGNARVPVSVHGGTSRALAPCAGVLWRLVPCLRPYADGQARYHGSLPRSAIYGRAHGCPLQRR